MSLNWYLPDNFILLGNNNKTGYTVKINSPQAIADAITKLIENESIYKDFSNNALDRAKYFTSNEIVDKYILLFQQYCNQTF
jgi:glycosyltransferase involved in cell wall biosynthesis